MAKTVWNPAHLASLLTRIDSLQPNQPAKFGKMTVSQMVRHCTVPLYGTMGELKVTQKNTFIKIWPMPKLIIYALPWPKGAPTAPEFIITDEGDLTERKAALRAALEKFIAKGESQTFQPHAAFGVLSAKDWGALVHRHMDHHLKQFSA
jgi:hypothetical protein